MYLKGGNMYRKERLIRFLREAFGDLLGLGLRQTSEKAGDQEVISYWAKRKPLLGLLESLRESLNPSLKSFLNSDVSSGDWIRVFKLSIEKQEGKLVLNRLEAKYFGGLIEETEDSAGRKHKVMSLEMSLDWYFSFDGKTWFWAYRTVLDQDGLTLDAGRLRLVPLKREKKELIGNINPLERGVLELLEASGYEIFRYELEFVRRFLVLGEETLALSRSADLKVGMKFIYGMIV